MRCRVCLLLICAVLVDVHSHEEFEPRPYDGWFNNLENPDWGAAETAMLRQSKVDYSDGVYAPSGGGRPNPLVISRAAHQGPAGRPSSVGRTAMLVYYGQQLVEELMDAQSPGCPIEFFNIRVPEGHPKFDPNKTGNMEMTFRRSRYDHRSGFSPNNPRKILNEITPFLDGQLIYGPAKAWTDAIREFKGGRLAATSPDNIMMSFPLNNTARLPYANPPVVREHKLRPVSRFHAIGNPRGHENPFLLAFGILWHRWHNYQAGQISSRNPNYTDEQIFEIARKRVIALYQKITFYDWLPLWLNISVSPEQFRLDYPYYRSNGSRGFRQVPYQGKYSGYDPDIHPGIKLEFQSAAMRFGHTLVPPGLWRRAADGCSYLPSVDPDTKRQFAALRLCNTFFDARRFVEEDLDSLFRGMATTIAEQEDSIVVSDLTESVFGPLEFSRRDLAALNIQRGRDHGLADYNSVRESYGLPRKQTWASINPLGYNLKEIAAVRALYNKSGDGLDDIDLFTGGMLETTAEGPGELFQRILLDQFLRIRHGDRFWYENRKESGLTDAEIYDIENLQLVDVINAVTFVSSQQTQRNVFLFQSSDNVGCFKQPAQLDPEGSLHGVPMLQPCTDLRTYDYFSGSEVSFTLTFLVLAACVPVTLLIMFLLSRHKRQTMYKTRVPPPTLQRTESANTNEFAALEWVDLENPGRIVTVFLDTIDGKISVFNPQRVLMRFVDLLFVPSHITRKSTKVNASEVEIHVSSDKMENFAALKLPEYDLVLQFSSIVERDRFVTQLTHFLDSRQIQNTKRQLVENYILRNAVTRRVRQERLNKFFKKILRIFEEGDTREENMYVGDGDTLGSELTRIELTQAEFGEAFGLKPSSMFVKHMFMLVDSDKSGRVSFREFLDIFILLSSDDIDNKISLLFKMYDVDSRGVLTNDDVKNMVRSLLDLSENATDDRVSEFTAAVYREAGLRAGTEMTYSDFKKVFQTDHYAQTIRNATLGLNDPDADADQAASPTSPAGPNARMIRRRSTLVRGYSGVPDPPPPKPHEFSSESFASRLKPPSRPPPRNLHLQVASGTRKDATISHANGGRRETDSGEGLSEMSDKVPVRWRKVQSYLATYRLQIFWLTLYCLVTAGIFLERAYYYSTEREDRGLRRVAGHGITMSRGSASVIMFTYSGLLITMCKNMITALRETVLNRVVPFDSFHSMHKIIACISLAFTVIHIIFHGSNLYHICTQASLDLNCYLREYFRASHELASFHYWAYGTTTGITGVIVTILLIVLFTFSLPYARRFLFHAFYNTHRLYYAIYPLVFLHGSVRMVQEPHFFYYVVGPAVIFAVDKLVSLNRRTLELTVVKAELLPSEVTALKVKKPPDFVYKSGQWAQVAVVPLGSAEFHPLTMTSSPHENFLSFHIRAVGPWTTNVRRLFDPSQRTDGGMPKLILDGPFGEGHQNWYKFEVSVLIGGGIGVTPFSSIIKDIVHKSKSGIPMQCKKVYFLWVTRTQKQFEWVTDIIRSVEEADQRKIVTTHIFVTEIKTNFDIRTSMLYICERHFQKICGRSLFTGLEATTHFGRPRFFRFLDSLRNRHPKARRIGVFSCGPGPMTLAVEKAVQQVNKCEYPTYYHSYENF
ncbi:hypothetical protein DPMN_117365 [Dreissena polymorpha]|uniref:NAD(P)H oxidase (H2O2-forming) n=3 Tax=Dreissena polymorpha TaxID=45954 RepID=A0A9D4KQH8_DREPO|nr:hypothetical protein DPMN_117365 [Dreissena polymorpha]